MEASAGVDAEIEVNGQSVANCNAEIGLGINRLYQK